MKPKTLVMQAENRRMLVKFLTVDFSALLFVEKQTHYDPDYVAKIPQMETITQQLSKALSSEKTNELWIEDFVSTYSQVKPFVAMIEKAVSYLISEKWKPKDYFLNPQPRDKNITVMQADLIRIIDLLNTQD